MKKKCPLQTGIYSEYNFTCDQISCVCWGLECTGGRGLDGQEKKE